MRYIATISEQTRYHNGFDGGSISILQLGFMKLIVFYLTGFHD
jgi:hypothetical protein